MEVREGFGSHEIAILDFPVPRRAGAALIDDMTPVEVTWGNSAGTLRQFQGYVNHPEIVESSGESRVRYLCVGTSLPLNEPSLSAWSNVSASYVAKRVAEKHGLRSVVSRSTQLHPYVSGGNESDFSLLQSLAEKIGYRLWVNSGTLYFVDPLTLIRRSTHAPELSMGGPRDNLLGLDVVSGTLAPRAGQVGSVKTIFGIDRHSGRLLQSSSAKSLKDRGFLLPKRRSVLTGSVETAEEARALANNDATNVEWVTAKADIRGGSAVRLGGLVNVTGRRVREELRGGWLVSGVTHVIESSEASVHYSSELEITRNSKYDVQFRESGNVALGGRDVSSTLIAGERWESSIKEAVYV